MMLPRLSNQLLGLISALVVSVAALGLIESPGASVEQREPRVSSAESVESSAPGQRSGPARAMLDAPAPGTAADTDPSELRAQDEIVEGGTDRSAEAAQRRLDRDTQAYSPGVASSDGGKASFEPIVDTLSADRALGAMGNTPGSPGEYMSSMSSFLAGLLTPAARTGSRSRPADRELPQATVDEPYCEALEQPEGTQFPAAQLSGGIVPKGLFLDQSSGRLCGTPTESGIFRFSVTFTFLGGQPESKTFRLVVAEADEGESEGELRLTTTQLAVGTVGAEYVFQLSAQGDERPYRWNVTGLPANLEFDSASGIIAGTPEEEGEFLLTVTVAGKSGAAASLSYSLLVRNTPVFITTHSIEEGIVKSPYQARFAAQGGALPYRWQLAGAIPSGFHFNPDTAVLEGASDEPFEGVLQVKVQDKDDAVDTAAIPFRIRASSLSVTTVSLGTGFAGQPYSFALAASGGTPPYIWSLSGGELPPGLSLNPAGALTGVPSFGGEFGLVLEVHDTEGLTASRSVQLLVQDAPATPDPEAGNGPFPEPPAPPETESPDGDDSPDGQNPGGSGGGDDEDSEVELPGVTSLKAIPSDRKVALTWKNPVHGSFTRTVVVRGDAAAPASAAEGTIVYSGSETSAIDIGLQTGAAYGYAAFAEYLPGTEGTARPSEPAVVMLRPISLDAAPDPFIDRVASFSPIDPACFNCSAASAVVLGKPLGGGESQGSLDIVSIGAKVNEDGGRSAPYGGSITVEFTDNIVVNGPGVDFTIFENAFRISGSDLYFLEPAIVEVSADGERFYRFPVDFVPHFNADGALNLFNPFCYAKGFAGVRPVYSNRNNASSPAATNSVRSGGDQFDLSDLPGAPLPWIRFIRITSTGDAWMVDAQGEVIRHSNVAPFFGASGKGNSGFDLDAIVALNY